MSTLYGAMVRDAPLIRAKEERRPSNKSTKSTNLHHINKEPPKPLSIIRDDSKLAPPTFFEPLSPTTATSLPSTNPGIIQRVLNRVRSNSDLSRRPADSYYRRRKSSFKATKDVVISRDLWEEAYDSLRLNPSTASLVTTYEAVISQELPEEVKQVVDGRLSPADGDKERRMELMSAIVGAGLGKRRGSRATGSGVDDMPRLILEHCKNVVEKAWEEVPAAALAWAGLCCLTPLLLDPILRHQELNKGILHIIGRIQWYMNLTALIQAAARHDADDLTLRQPNTSSSSSALQRCRAAVVELYRRVLELEMNCVLASASVWNSLARHTVRWGSLGSLNEEVREAGAGVMKLVEEEVRGGMRELLVEWDRDFDVKELEGRIEEEEVAVEG